MGNAVDKKYDKLINEYNMKKAMKLQYKEIQE